MSVILIVVITAADLRLAGSYEEQQLPAVNTAEQQLLIRAIQAVSGIKSTGEMTHHARH
jgi:hypothetical protein